MLRFRLWVLVLAFSLLVPMGVAGQEPRLEQPGDADALQEDLLEGGGDEDRERPGEDCRRLFASLQQRLRSLSASFDEEKKRLQEEQRKASAEAKSERERQAWAAAYEDALDALTREHRGSLQQVHEVYGERCQEQDGRAQAGATLLPVVGYCTDPELSGLLERRFEKGMQQIEQSRLRHKAVFDAQQQERRETFEAQEQSAFEERRAFALEQKRLEDLLDERLQALERTARAELRASEHAFMEQMQERCAPEWDQEAHLEPPGQGELRLARMECDLEASRFPHWQGEEDLRGGCQDRLDALWDARLRALQATPRIDRFGEWTADEHDPGHSRLSGRYVDMRALPDLGTFMEFTVGPTMLIERISTSDATPLHLEQDDRDAVIQATGNGYHLEWMDNPTGLFRYRVPEEGSLLLHLPAGAHVTPTSNGFEVAQGGHQAILRTGPHAAKHDADHHTLTLTGEGIFWVPRGGDNLVLPGAANQYRQVIMQAVEDRRLGAEITLTAAGDGGPHHEALLYEDLELEALAEPDKRRVSVTVASDSLHQGRAFVVNIDEGLLDPRGRLKVEYFDVDPETGAKTPVKIERAASLTGVLTKTNGGTPVYWTVMGGDGLQWIVFVPQWSAHAFTITSEHQTARFEVPVTPIMMSVVVAGVGLFVRVTRRFS